MSQKIKEITRGGQITFHNIRMFIQINKTITTLFFLIFFILVLPLSYWILEPGLAQFFLKFMIAKIFSILPPIFSNSLLKAHTIVNVPLDPPVIAESAWRVYLNPDFHEIVLKFLKECGLAVAASFFTSVIGTSLFVSWLGKRGKLQTDNQFVRGATLSTPNEVKKIILKRKMASDITIDGFPLIKNCEVQHFLVHGTTGSGKGQCISKILDWIRKRGDRAIIYDKGCSFTQHYYREDKDIILNPFDKRCANWDLWEEALDAADFENMAESLIPMHGENDPFWVNAARTIFASVIFRMKGEKDRSILKLIKLLLTAELEDLESYLKGTEAATLVSGKNEKTAISIRSVITTYLKSLCFLNGLDRDNDVSKPSFSIREWVQSETSYDNQGMKNDSWLFISSNAQQHSSIRPLISMWLAMASITLLGLPENFDRRIWFIVDELPSLHKLPQLPETIAEVRKFGGCFLLGMQSCAQLEKVYGRNAAKEVFDLLNTRFFFRSPSADMAKVAAQELGEGEEEDVRENYSYGANPIRDGISLSKQRQTRQLVTYSEMMNLKDLDYYLRLPSDLPVVKATLELDIREKFHPGFIKREIPDIQFSNNDSKKSDEEVSVGTGKRKKTSKSEINNKVSPKISLTKSDVVDEITINTGNENDKGIGELNESESNSVKIGSIKKNVKQIPERSFGIGD